MLSLLKLSLSLLVILPLISAAPPPPPPKLGSEKVAAAWYASWHATDFPLSKVSWSKYTQMTYAFAITTSNPNVISLQDSDKQLLPQFVSAAHKNGVKASLSIGGWTGSQYYSSNVGSATNRTAFVKSVTALATQYKLDAIDFDWEYPNGQGIGCNVVSASDTANFLSFLQLLRKNPVGAKLTLSAAVSITPFIGANGKPSTDVSGFSKVLNFIAIMNYDVWGSWSPKVGPNAPLDDTCAAPANRAGSAVSAVKAWRAAGMPSDQIVLGVPAYGHSFSVSPSSAFVHGSHKTLAAYPAFDASVHPTGDAWDGGAGTADVCGVIQPAAGTWDFWGLIAGGFLKADGTPQNGIAYRYDECSQTPYVYNQTMQLMVSYDNAQSFKAKGAFIKNNGLAGFAMWEAGGDSKDILLDSIRESAGHGSSVNVEFEEDWDCA